MSNVSDVTILDTWQETVEVDQTTKTITKITTPIEITIPIEITTPTKTITSTTIEIMDKITKITDKTPQTEGTLTT